MFNDEGLGAAMGRAHQDSRLEVLEKRLLLLMRAGRGEFMQAPVGTFEKRWNEADPSTPAPPIRSVVDHTNACMCEPCVARRAREEEAA